MPPAPLFPDTSHAANPDELFMLWLYDLPTWLFALIIIASFVFFGLLGLMLVHRRFNRSAQAALIDNGTVGWFFSGVTVLYGLLLGLLTVATWSNYTQATSIASQEAAAMAVLYRDVTAYPPQQRQLLREQLRQYTRFIIERSWPLQRRGFIHDGESARLEVLQNELLTINPTSQGEQIVHAEAVRAFNSLVELRRQRSESIGGSVPGVIWYVVLLGALLTIVFAYFFVVKEFWLHGWLVGMLSAVIGLLIFLIAALDHPYWGEVSVSPAAYQLVLDKVMKP